MDRDNHYETAFLAYLRDQRLTFVAVNETKRSFLGEESVKSLDFIVVGDEGTRLLVDIKGRRFPMGKPEKRRRVWECWCTREDIDGLARWAELFGSHYVGLLVFVYHVLDEVTLFEDTADVWTWNERRYLLRAVAATDYRQHMRVRSPRWGTMTLPRADFRRLVRPFSHYARMVGDAPPANDPVVMPSSDWRER